MAAKDIKPPAAGQPTLVSVGMPVYNGAAYLRPALDAILAQDHPVLELIISDNASTDETEAICREYAARDSRISYHRNPVNIGPIDNFNRVYTLSSGEFFVWASDHDLRNPSFISRCLAVMAGDPSVVLCYPLATWIELDGSFRELMPVRLDTRGQWKAARYIMVNWGTEYPYQIYGLLRRSALERTGLFNKTLGTDNILLAELSLLGAFALVPEPLLAIRPTSFGRLTRHIADLNRRATTWSVIYSFAQMLGHHFRVIRIHTNSWTGRMVLFLAIAHCLSVRYSGLLWGMLKEVWSGKATAEAK